MNYIGIDLGTSAVKLLLMQQDGRILKIVNKEYPISFPKPGWSQQEPEDWYRETIAGIKELLEGSDKNQVAGISFGGQMHGLVVLDEKDQVIRPAILWNDGRTAEESDYLNCEIGRETLSEYTANISFAGFTASKVLWMKKHEPELFAKINKLMLPKDYLAYRLSGTHCTDVSDASGTLFFDVKNRCWSQEMCNICGIEKSWLPKVYESSEAVGTLKPELAAELGVSEHVVVAAGAGDNAAAAVGTGIVREGRAFTTIGTSGVVFAHSDKVTIDKKGRVHTFCCAVPGAWHVMGVTQGAGLSLKWFRDNFCQDYINRAKLEGKDAYEYINEDVAEIPVGSNRLIYLPYLMGERTPHLDPDCRGVFFGLSAIHTRKDMLRAVMEGVSYSLKDCNDILKEMGVEVDEMMACGGGGRSPIWRQMLADMYNCKVKTVTAKEGPALGVAILAGVGTGIYESVQAACDKVLKIDKECTPISEHTEKYAAYHKVYQELYPALKNQYKALQEI